MDDDSKWGEVGRGGSKDPGRWQKLLKRRLPILSWAPNYDRTMAAADLVAGITLGLTLVPQSIAYAALADLPVQYGLYSSFIGTMLYVFLGTVKEVSIGPTSLMALLTLETCSGLPIQFVVLLTFLSGAVVFAMGLLRMGFLVELISPSVTSGFTSATAVIIVVSQLKGLLGLSFSAETVIEGLSLLYVHAHETRFTDALLGGSCCVVLLLFRALKDLPVGPKRPRLKRALWLVSIARNALVVCVASTLAYCTSRPGHEHPYFKLSGRVEPGLPPVSAPPFGMESVNGTVSFMEMAQRLSSGILMMPVVMVLANIAIAKAFSGGQRVDATQEMLTLGLCNMAGSLFHAMPTCGAFTRSAVSHSSGVRTPLAGLYSGLITLTALAFMTQCFYFIPRACLSAVLICAVIFMIDHASVLKYWRTSKPELFILTLTFTVSVLGSVELALLCGALASLARVLRRVMRPRVQLRSYKTDSGEVLVCRPTLALVYLNAEHVTARVYAHAARTVPRPVLIDAGDLSLLDQSAIESLERLIKKLQSSEQRLIIYNASAEVLRKLELVSGVDARALRARDVTTACRPRADHSATAPLLTAEV